MKPKHERRMQHEKRALIDAAKKCIPPGFEYERGSEPPTFSRVGAGTKYQINEQGFVVQLQRRA
tara:strand:- start:18 stop:209 length:192 start_codon:yes stop_codon:yes gene_type:complete